MHIIQSRWLWLLLSVNRGGRTQFGTPGDVHLAVDPSTVLSPCCRALREHESRKLTSKSWTRRGWSLCRLAKYAKTCTWKNWIRNLISIYVFWGQDAISPDCRSHDCLGTQMMLHGTTVEWLEPCTATKHWHCGKNNFKHLASRIKW